MNAEIPLEPAVRSVAAIATSTWPTRPCVVNAFDPLRIQQSPLLTAAVRRPAASLPELASVSPHAPIFSPRASGTRYCCFWDSLPNIAICAEQRPLCAATESEMLG